MQRSAKLDLLKMQISKQKKKKTRYENYDTQLRIAYDIPLLVVENLTILKS